MRAVCARLSRPQPRQFLGVLLLLLLLLFLLHLRRRPLLSLDAWPSDAGDTLYTRTLRRWLRGKWSRARRRVRPPPDLLLILLPANTVGRPRLMRGRVARLRGWIQHQRCRHDASLIKAHRLAVHDFEHAAVALRQRVAVYEELEAADELSGSFGAVDAQPGVGAVLAPLLVSILQSEHHAG